MAPSAFSQTSDLSFIELVDNHSGMVYHTALRITRDEHLAQDVSQEVFLKLHHNLSNIRESVASWLHRTATHRAIDLYRQRKRRQGHESQYKTEQEEGSSPFGEHWQNDLDEALEILPAESREILTLHYFERRSQAEIASLKGRSQPTVSRQLKQALELMRTELAQRGSVCSLPAMVAFLEKDVLLAAPSALCDNLSRMGLLHVTQQLPIKAGWLSSTLPWMTKVALVVVSVGLGMLWWMQENNAPVLPQVKAQDSQAVAIQQRKVSLNLPHAPQSVDPLSGPSSTAPPTPAVVAEETMPSANTCHLTVEVLSYIRFEPYHNLSIEAVEESGANLYRPIGKRIQVVELPYGSYQIKVDSNRSDQWKDEVTVRLNQPHQKVTLQPKAGECRLDISFDEPVEKTTVSLFRGGGEQHSLKDIEGTSASWEGLRPGLYNNLSFRGKSAGKNFALALTGLLLRDGEVTQVHIEPHPKEDPEGGELHITLPMGVPETAQVYLNRFDLEKQSMGLFRRNIGGEQKVIYRHLEPGVYDVHIYNALGFFSKLAEVLPGRVSHVDFTENEASQAALKVTFVRGDQPLAKRVVTLRGSNRSIRRLTDEAGIVNFGHLTPGNITLQSGEYVEHLDLKAGIQELTVDVARGEEAPLDIKVSRDGEPIHVRLSLQKQHGKGRLTWDSSCLGSHQFEKVPPGTYNLHVTDHTTSETKSLHVDVPAEKRAPIDVKFASTPNYLEVTNNSPIPQGAYLLVPASQVDRIPNRYTSFSSSTFHGRLGDITGTSFCTDFMHHQVLYSNIEPGEWFLFVFEVKSFSFHLVGTHPITITPGANYFQVY